MTIRVYGSSDDLIEIDGDILEEFGAYDSSPVYLGFSDGTVLSISYTRTGVWRIAPEAPGTADLTIVQAPAADEDNYSDVATLTGDVRWVIKGTEIASAR